MKKIWTTYIYDLTTFVYFIRIPVNSNNYQEKILSFDKCFLEKGNHFGIFNFLPSEKLKNNQIENRINLYIKDRKQDFFLEDDNYLKLVGLSQWKYYTEKYSSIKIPIIEDKSVRYEQYFAENYRIQEQIVDIENSGKNSIDDFHQEIYWETEVSIALCSSSNIWFDEIDFTILEDNVKPTVIKPPANNRPVAYRITPRFNSFLRAIKNKTTELGGHVILDNGCSSKATQDGLLLDGKIIYQEDIDSGKVKILDVHSFIKNPLILQYRKLKRYPR